EWIQGLEFIFEVMDCPDRYRVICAQLQLTGDARLWWNAYWSMRPGEKAGCTWDMLKELIREKYYPTYYRAEMERQFLSLQQGTRTVDEYEREFTRLAAFVSDMVRTEAQRAQRFIDGLYPAVRHNIVGHGTQTYARAVSIAQEVDASIRREAVRDRSQPSAPVQPFTAPPAIPSAQPTKEKKRKGKGAQTDRRTRQRQQQVPPCPTCGRLHRGETALYKLRAAVSIFHYALKFPTTRGEGTHLGDQREARQVVTFIPSHGVHSASTSNNETSLQHHHPNDVVTEEPSNHIGEPSTSDPLTEDRGRRPGKEPLLEEDELDPRALFKDKSRPDRAEPGEDVELVYIDEPIFHKSLRIGSHLQEPLRSELIAFLKQNSDVFAWKHEDMKGIDPGVASHKLNLDRTVRPVVQKRRKLGPDRQKALEEEVKKLVDNKFIKEAKYPTWVSNPVLVKKSNGLWRLCIDFSDLNKACPKDSYPLPHIDYMVDATSGHELMSFMDAYSGYNQIPMDPEDSEYTSFYSARGLYCYTMMPFGLKNAGATYQRLVNKMFATLIEHTMEVYVDDMLVKSVHASDHITHLRDMFAILRCYSMVLNPKKCTFGVESGKFLGYMVSQRGIEANPAKIKAIQDLTPPTSVKGVQALTGRLAALNRFISKSTDRCKPFFEAIKKGKRFEWTEECQKALDNLKETLISPPTLQKPKPEEMLFLYLGVSESAISAVLISEEGLLQSPIYYVSKALHDAELRYPPMEKLTFALVIAARKLRPYFQEHSITVRTSYPLRQILHRPDTSGRMVKWAIELGQFDIHYQPRTAIKAQTLSDFIAEFTPAITVHCNNQPWVLYIDGSSTADRAGAGIVLADPENRLF
ncbi:Unknown protein, partial [Striga hermonthica]